MLQMSRIAAGRNYLILWPWKHTFGMSCKHETILQFRCVSISPMIYKRRKTAEERKAPRIVEFAPKKGSHKTFLGVADIWRHMAVAELASVMDKSVEDVQEAMLYVGGSLDLDPNSRLDDVKVIREIAEKCGMKTRIVAAPHDEDVEQKGRDVYPRPPANPENMKQRPPVVTVMGHVDHGKTTLLDSLRGAAVAASEAGGITQHIGAFTVTLENGEKVTFLDTPGHAAFSAMRARGAHVTDIIVLVVAADDGVMAQTKEVIKLAQDDGVPLIVAINKIDKPEADVEKTKRELMQCGVMLEGYGGEVQVVCVSALEGKGLDELTEALSTQATIMGLKADYGGLVEGTVVESRTDAKRGKLSTAIVTRGTLRRGCILVSGVAWAKVRGLFDHIGRPVDNAPPGNPVEVLGWRELPFAGELVLEVESEKKAHSVIHWRLAQEQKEKAERDREAILVKEQEHLEKYRADREARRMLGRYRHRPQGPRTKQFLDDDTTPKVNIVIKGDVHGTVEAILDVLDTYTSNHVCRLDIIHYGVGNVVESDLEMAEIFNAIIYAFSVETPPKVAKHIMIRKFDVIYRLIDDLKEEISKKLPPKKVEDVFGEANVLQAFFITEGKKEVPVAGCRCTKGLLKKNSIFRLVRNGEIVYNGGLESMRHLKNEVDSVKKDVECGLRLKDTSIVPEPGDVIVCYRTRTESQKTDWDPGF